MFYNGQDANHENVHFSMEDNNHKNQPYGQTKQFFLMMVATALNEGFLDTQDIEGLIYRYKQFNQSPPQQSTPFQTPSPSPFINLPVMNMAGMSPSSGIIGTTPTTMSPSLSTGSPVLSSPSNLQLQQHPLNMNLSNISAGLISNPSEQRPPPNDKEFNGVIKCYVQRDGYGFIQCNSLQSVYPGQDVFLHHMQIVELGEPLRRGDLVKFTIRENEKQQPQARSLKLIQSNGGELIST